MVVKTITITEDAYHAIKRLKMEHESFSDLFKRLGSKPATVKDIMGIAKSTPEDAEELAKRVKDMRKQIGKDLAGRITHVRSRLQRDH